MSVERFSLIWLAVIGSMAIGVLLMVSPLVGALMLGAVVAAFFGLRWTRRKRQVLHREDPDLEKDVEPEDGEIPGEPSDRRTDTALDLALIATSSSW
jgi:uncharacterized membrane protein